MWRCYNRSRIAVETACDFHSAVARVPWCSDWRQAEWHKCWAQFGRLANIHFRCVCHSHRYVYDNTHIQIFSSENISWNIFVGFCRSDQVAAWISANQIEMNIYVEKARIHQYAYLCSVQTTSVYFISFFFLSAVMAEMKRIPVEMLEIAQLLGCGL